MTSRLTPCASTPCPNGALAPAGQSYCPACLSHRRKQSRARNPRQGNPHNTAAFRRARASQLRRNPNCETCGAPATDVDHRNGDSTDHRAENLASLCHSHHSQKTATHDNTRGPDGRWQAKRRTPDQPPARRRGAFNIDL